VCKKDVTMACRFRDDCVTNLLHNLAMHRILAILLICLLPLQSFAGAGVSEKMACIDAAMSQMQMTGSVQAPCHEASQPMQAAEQDCCDPQAMCHSLCQMATALSTASQFFSPFTVHFIPSGFVLIFQSADLRTGFKPPIL
jgi:hypothetical protein